MFNFSSARPPPLGHIQQLSSGYNNSVSVDVGDDGLPHSRANSVSSSGREKSIKMRLHNQFIKKVPRGAECCNIQAATFPFLKAPLTVFARLKNAVLLEDFCEINAPTRFLCLVLGPTGEDERVMQMGRALGALMSDQLFPLVAYRARAAAQLFSAFDDYAEDVTVLAPSAWDPDIRLDPPKNVPSLDSRYRN